MKNFSRKIRREETT